MSATSRLVTGRKKLHMLTTNQKDQAKQFLKATKAKQISVEETDTTRRTVYEIDVLENGTDLRTEVWIEIESGLEAPEYFYNLFQFQGEE